MQHSPLCMPLLSSPAIGPSPYAPDLGDLSLCPVSGRFLFFYIGDEAGRPITVVPQPSDLQRFMARPSKGSKEDGGPRTTVLASGVSGAHGKWELRLVAKVTWELRSLLSQLALTASEWTVQGVLCEHP